ncbi:MAG: hypothetical protein R2867_22195 [Caldilineaceae bacterium]
MGYRSAPLDTVAITVIEIAHRAGDRRGRGEDGDRIEGDRVVFRFAVRIAHGHARRVDQITCHRRAGIDLHLDRQRAFVAVIERIERGSPSPHWQRRPVTIHQGQRSSLRAGYRSR